MTRSKQQNGDVGEISVTEAVSELSSKLLMVVSSIESTNQELMYTIRRENQMTNEIIFQVAQKKK